MNNLMKVMMMNSSIPTINITIHKTENEVDTYLTKFDNLIIRVIFNLTPSIHFKFHKFKYFQQHKEYGNITPG